MSVLTKERTLWNFPQEHHKETLWSIPKESFTKLDTVSWSTLEELSKTLLNEMELHEVLWKSFKEKIWVELR